MNSTSSLIALCAVVSGLACSSESDPDWTVGAGAPGSAGMSSNRAGAGGAGAGPSSSGAATGGSLQQAGAGGSPSAGGSPVNGVGGAGVGGAGVGGAGVGAAGVGAAGVGAAGGSAAGGRSAGGSGGGNGTAGGAAAGAGPVDGATLFAANCAACHGTQGVGGTRGPELQHPVRDYSAWVVRHGLPGTGFPAPMAIITPATVSDANLNLIWDYLAKPAQPTTGKALYLDYCGNCHGADGKGGPTGRNILNELSKLKTQVRNGAHLGQFSMRKDYMPAFTTTQISDAELNLIYTYVDSL